MVHSEPVPAVARREGFLAGAVIGAALAARTSAASDPGVIREVLAAGARPLPPPPGRRRAATALADGLLEELLGGGVDLQRLAGRWTTWGAEDGLDADPALLEALAHLREFDAPIGGTALRGPSALAAVLPAALASASPRSMLSGAFHTARLLDPDPESALAAAAVVVAASRLLEGHRDFMADVLGVLRANDADAAFFDRFQEIPRDPRQMPAAPVGASVSAAEVAIWVLWLTHHRPRSAEILTAMVSRGRVSPTAGAVLGALLGARDGLMAWPRAWCDEAGEGVTLRRAVAKTIDDRR
jgi:ADP-ribosylglycohydrolase